MVVSVLWLFLAMRWVGMQSVIVVIPDHTHLLSLSHRLRSNKFKNLSKPVMQTSLSFFDRGYSYSYS